MQIPSFYKLERWSLHEFFVLPHVLSLSGETFSNREWDKMVGIWIYLETSSPHLGITSGIFNTATEDCRNKSWEPDCGELQSPLPIWCSPWPSIFKGNKCGVNISESVAMVLCGWQCLPGAVASAFPMLSLLSFKGRKLPPCLGSPFLCLAEPLCSYLFLLRVCREGIACYLPTGKPCHLLRFVATALGRSHPRKPYLCHFWGSLSPLSSVVRGNNTFIGSRDYRNDREISSSSNFIVTSVVPLHMNPH